MMSQTSPSDEELIRAAQAGRLDAFNMLCERYLQPVYRRVRYLVPANDVEDVTQEVFIAVMKSLKNFRYEAQFSTWLRTLVNRQVANYYRGRSPQTDYLEEIGGPDPDHSPMLGKIDNTGLIDEEIMVRQALEQLPEHYREIILLRFADGLQFDEIAQVQGQSLEATKSLFRRAIATLQKQVTNV